jgi:four helix bundle protein
MDDFRRLKAWQLAAQISLDLRTHFTAPSCRVLPGFRTQLLTAAQSVSFNLAEAYGRRTRRDRLRFIDQSLGSLFEVEGAIELGRMHGIIPERVRQSLMSRITVERRMLIALRGSIDRQGGREA